MSQLAFLQQLAQQSRPRDPAGSGLVPSAALGAPPGAFAYEVLDSTSQGMAALDLRVQFGRREARLMVRATHLVQGN